MKTNQIKIRPAKIEDAEQLLQLAKEDHAESVFKELKFSDKKFKNLFQDSIDNNKNNIIALVAQHQNNITGFIYCILGEYFVADGGLIASINTIYVKKSIRTTLLGGKVALKLMQAVNKSAKSQGAIYLLAHVSSGISISQTDKFLRKLGMQTLGGNYAIKVK